MCMIFFPCPHPNWTNIVLIIIGLGKPRDTICEYVVGLSRESHAVHGRSLKYNIIICLLLTHHIYICTLLFIIIIIIVQTASGIANSKERDRWLGKYLHVIPQISHTHSIYRFIMYINILKPV